MPPKKKPIKAITSFTGSVGRNHDEEFLVIVESPSKIGKIKSYLGPGYHVIASMGHITHIEGLKNIDHIHHYQVQYAVLASKRVHVEEMRETLRGYTKDRIIIATDNDREGEAIGFHLCEVFGLPLETTRRIVFNEITPDALQYAIAHPSVLNLNIIRSQHARQILDMFIGFKLSPLLWKYVYSSKANTLSAGRCQTPALRLVYDNHMEGRRLTEGTGPSVQYKTVGHFFPPFSLACELNHAFQSPDEVRTFLKLSLTFDHRFSLAEKVASVRAPPAPLNTAKMLQTATHALHLPPKAIMNLAQKLYQEGHITYMRTEAKKYSQDFLQKASAYIQSLRYDGTKGNNARYVGDLTRLSNEGTGLPHEAIRVTDIYTTRIEGTDTKLNALYQFIWRNTVESCMAPAEYDVYKIRITAPQDHVYNHALEIPRFLGWKALMAHDASATKEAAEGQTVLLYLRSAKSALYIYLESSVVVIGLHSHYTESGLIQRLEDLGIGRPSTYAMFVDTIQERGYVLKTDVPGIRQSCTQFIMRVTDTDIQETVVEKEFGKERDKLVIQPLGILCMEFLLAHFQSLFAYDYTKHMEESLDKISMGCEDTGAPWYTICETTRRDILQKIKDMTHIHKQTYPLDATHDVVFQSFGPCVRVRNKEGSEHEYLPIKPSVKLDLEALKQGKYRREDLILYNRSHLGVYEGQEVALHTGPYGMYVTWGDIKKSLGTLEVAEQRMASEWGPGPDWDVETVGRWISGKSSPAITEGEGESEDSKIIRVLSQDMSLRRGQYGMYVYYKPSTAPRPTFINLRKFPEDAQTCEADILISWCMENMTTPKKYGGRGGRGGRGGHGGRGGRGGRKGTA
jgi:DNA topoisomerase I